MTFSRKIFLLLTGSIGVTLLAAFIFLHFTYRDLYLTTVRESVESQGQRTAAHYHSGELTEEIIEKIHWYNVVSEYEVLVADDLNELNLLFPYEIDGEMLVEESDRESLLGGQSMMKEGYVSHYGREVIGGVYPITDGTATAGYVYIFVPLEGLSQVFGSSIPLLIGAGVLFFIVLSMLVSRIRHSLFKPLASIESFSKSVSDGQYTRRLKVKQRDEIGQVSAALNQMSEALQHQEERKKEFLADIMHEVRTPLTYIQGYTERLKKSDQDKELILSTIESEVQRMNTLLSELVDLNRLEEGYAEFNRQPIAVADLLYDTSQLFSLAAKEKTLTVEADVDEELIVVQDEKRLQQIFYNLIENAVKYAPAESTVRISLMEEGAHMLLTVINDSTLTTAEKERLGERFYRADRDRNRETGGTGLGLAIVKQLVRLMNGDLTIDTEPSAFKIDISIPKEGQSE
ncbi:sensor histidine kinase [Jeotgalibacillus salarius]|uniref:histidine kinase n=1 Tax=Jeotgalibacillus salarius TaxID=546023 RepID=A0A4Y8LHD0_9BACL|nr:HAMP domain-containing sensor histidine kinase [Jeotgalibacillus salarius]TFE02202.1 HAMP domain-containing histidine kinase [Jeotgalibacillus salarius]